MPEIIGNRVKIANGTAAVCAYKRTFAKAVIGINPEKTVLLDKSNTF